MSVLELNHNHELVTPSEANLIETRRNVTHVAQMLNKTLNNAGVGSSRLMNVFSEIGGEMENIDFSDKDVWNVVRDIRHDIVDSDDAQGALQYLIKLESESPLKFFHIVKRDDNNRIACILWIDSRSIIAYKIFGDVVALDTRIGQISIRCCLFHSRG